MLVNFLIVGTQKGGTTALAQFLSQHPQVCMASQKEVHFFDADRRYLDASGTPKYDFYHSFFESCKDRPAIGEATPIYMYLPQIAERMKAYNRALKLIFILRDPTQRAYSQYCMEKERGKETLSFREAIDVEPERLRSKDLSLDDSHLRYHSYVDRGFYARQIRHLLAYFPIEQMLFLRNEDLAADHANTLAKVSRFLQIDDVPPPPPERVFEHRYPPMNPADERYLRPKFLQDIEELEAITSWDLRSWKGQDHGN